MLQDLENKIKEILYRWKNTEISVIEEGRKCLDEDELDKSKKLDILSLEKNINEKEALEKQEENKNEMANEDDNFRVVDLKNLDFSDLGKDKDIIIDKRVSNEDMLEIINDFADIPLIIEFGIACQDRVFRELYLVEFYKMYDSHEPLINGIREKMTKLYKEQSITQELYLSTIREFGSHFELDECWEDDLTENLDENVKIELIDEILKAILSFRPSALAAVENFNGYKEEYVLAAIESNAYCIHCVAFSNESFTLSEEIVKYTIELQPWTLIYLMDYVSAEMIEKVINKEPEIAYILAYGEQKYKEYIPKQVSNNMFERIISLPGMDIRDIKFKFDIFCEFPELILKIPNNRTQFYHDLFSYFEGIQKDLNTQKYSEINHCLIKSQLDESIWTVSNGPVSNLDDYYCSDCFLKINKLEEGKKEIEDMLHWISYYEYELEMSIEQGSIQNKDRNKEIKLRTEACATMIDNFIATFDELPNILEVYSQSNIDMWYESESINFETAKIHHKYLYAYQTKLFRGTTKHYIGLVRQDEREKMYDLFRGLYEYAFRMKIRRLNNFFKLNIYCLKYISHHSSSDTDNETEVDDFRTARGEFVKTINYYHNNLPSNYFNNYISDDSSYDNNFIKSGVVHQRILFNDLEKIIDDYKDKVGNPISFAIFTNEAKKLKSKDNEITYANANTEGIYLIDLEYFAEAKRLITYWNAR